MQYDLPHPQFPEIIRAPEWGIERYEPTPSFIDSVFVELLSILAITLWFCNCSGDSGSKVCLPNIFLPKALSFSNISIGNQMSAKLWLIAYYYCNMVISILPINLSYISPKLFVGWIGHVLFCLGLGHRRDGLDAVLIRGQSRSRWQVPSLLFRHYDLPGCARLSIWIPSGTMRRTFQCRLRGGKPECRMLPSESGCNSPGFGWHRR